MISRGDIFLQKIKKFLIQVKHKPEDVTLIIHHYNGDVLTMTLKDLIDLHEESEGKKRRQVPLDHFPEMRDSIAHLEKRKGDKTVH